MSSSTRYSGQMRVRVNALLSRTRRQTNRLDPCARRQVNVASLDMLGSIAEGRTSVSCFLEGDDALATLSAFRAMGVQITDPDAGRLTIEGVGLKGLRAPEQVMDVGNSGTSIRLMVGLLSGQSFDSMITGDQSLLRRPMGRVITPLSQMGALIGSHEGCPPLEIKGRRALEGIRYELPVASAQVKSSVLLAGLYARGRTSVTEPAPTRDHTERMLNGFGYPVDTQDGEISLEGGGTLTATDIDIPADISSAAFFLVGASIAPGSDLTLSMGVNPTRDGVIRILRAMGADIETMNERLVGGEPVADFGAYPLMPSRFRWKRYRWQLMNCLPCSLLRHVLRARQCLGVLRNCGLKRVIVLPAWRRVLRSSVSRTRRTPMVLKWWVEK